MFKAVMNIIPIAPLALSLSWSANGHAAELTRSEINARITPCESLFFSAQNLDLERSYYCLSASKWGSPLTYALVGSRAKFERLIESEARSAAQMTKTSIKKGNKPNLLFYLDGSALSIMKLNELLSLKGIHIPAGHEEVFSRTFMDIRRDNQRGVPCGEAHLILDKTGKNEFILIYASPYEDPTPCIKDAFLHYYTIYRRVNTF